MMPAPSSRLSGGVFHKLTVLEFKTLLDSVTPFRRIDAVHLHHTWRPRHQDYRGLDTIVGMWRFHTQQQRWSDIAQHLTIAPDGALWTGRHWDLPPASASGHNGSAQSGPFMIEMIGDFDAGHDPFAGTQREAALDVLTALCAKFQLPTSSIRFHNEMSSKTCPGTSLDRASLLADVDGMRTISSREPVDTPRASPFDEKEESLWHARAFLRPAQDVTGDTRAITASVEESYGAELPEADTRDRSRATFAAAAALETAAATGRGVDITLTPEIRESLRPYVVNLTRGKFSSTGEFRTERADVDRIFDEHLPRALSEAGAGPLRIVVYAHGGLVGELDGLGVALKHVDWWRQNHVYPIYFAWESGLLGSVLNIIRGATGGQRGIEASRDGLDVIDAQIEAAARQARASSIWADMKHVAELSSAADGGARYVASRLADFCKAHAQVEVHAIGHSAGSNFHSFFLPAALDAGVPVVKTLQFLAPAITVDAFFARLAPRLGSIGPMTIYTMKDPLEQADDCRRVYNKSLLYLVSRGLEEQRDMDLLGLEISVRNDLRLRRMFGLEGTASPRNHEIVWSQTTGDRRASSESVTHGGFDDDPATMNSALRRVVDRTGDQEVEAEFVRPGRSVDVATWSQGGDSLPAAGAPAALPAASAPAVAASTTVSSAAASAPGHRRALCVGINTYRQRPLRGCVADAERWAATLAALGFEVVPPLVNEHATRERILGELRHLLARSQAGDVVAFQFSGHGTMLPDVDGDEAGGDSPGSDEALCPYDYTEGHFVIDDDLAAVFGAAPSGVVITSFIDCCHSGTVTRLGLGPSEPPASDADGPRPRYIDADEVMIEAHVAFRAREGGRSLGGQRSSRQRDVLFSACRSTEVAWESQGQGDFTRHATAILQAGAQGLTNGALLSRISSALGQSPRQHPEVNPPDALMRSLFASDGQAPGALAMPVVASGGTGRTGELAVLLHAIANLLER